MANTHKPKTYHVCISFVRFKYHLLRLVDKQPSHHRWVLNLIILPNLNIITPISHSTSNLFFFVSHIFNAFFQSCFFLQKHSFFWQKHVYHLAYFSTVFWYMIIVFLFLTPKTKIRAIRIRGAIHPPFLVYLIFLFIFLSQDIYDPSPIYM